MTFSQDFPEGSHSGQWEKLYIAASVPSETKLLKIIDRLLQHDVPAQTISIAGRSLPQEIFDELKDVSVFNVPLIDRVMVTGLLRLELLAFMTISKGRGLSSGLMLFLMSLGMPLDQAANYQTCLQDDRFLIIVETCSKRINIIQSELDFAGAQQISYFSAEDASKPFYQ